MVIPLQQYQQQQKAGGKNTAVTKGEQINRNLNTQESFILVSLPVLSYASIDFTMLVIYVHKLS